MKTSKKIYQTIMVAILMLPFSLWYGLRAFCREFSYILIGYIKSFANIWE